MKKILSLFIFFFSFFVFLFAQQPQRVDLREASSSITTSLNALNSLYQDLNRQGEVDKDINAKIRSISTMIFPCRQAVVNANHNIRSMTDDKKEKIVTTAKDLETVITEIDTKDVKDSILFRLDSAEKNALDLSKLLGIKTKKSKKK